MRTDVKDIVFDSINLESDTGTTLRKQRIVQKPLMDQLTISHSPRVLILICQVPMDMRAAFAKDTRYIQEHGVENIVIHRFKCTDSVHPLSGIQPKTIRT